MQKQNSAQSAEKAKKQNVFAKNAELKTKVAESSVLIAEKNYNSFGGTKLVLHYLTNLKP